MSSYPASRVAIPNTVPQIVPSLAPQSTDLSHFTTWGNGFSFGRVVGDALSLPGQGIEKIGLACRNVQWLPAFAGSSINQLGGLARGIGGIAGSAVTVLERTLFNVLNSLGGVALTAVGIFALPFGNASLFNRGIEWVQGAWTARGKAQTNLPRSCSDRDRAQRICQKMSSNPTPIRSITTSKQHPEKSPATVMQLARTLPVYVQLNQDPNGDIYVLFGGAGNLKAFSSAIVSLLGVEDETFRTARQLVRDLAELNPGQVHVMGISLGGALAQYAGISAGVPVTCINSLALSPALIDKLVDWDDANPDKLKRARVEHFNAKDDWLSQGIQGNSFLRWVNQLGIRNIVPEAYSRYSNDDEYDMANDSHNLPHMFAAIHNYSF